MYWQDTDACKGEGSPKIMHQQDLALVTTQAMIESVRYQPGPAGQNLGLCKKARVMDFFCKKGINISQNILDTCIQCRTCKSWTSTHTPN